MIYYIPNPISIYTSFNYTFDQIEYIDAELVRFAVAWPGLADRSEQWDY